MGKRFIWFDATTCGPSGARSVHHMMHRQHLFFFLFLLCSQLTVPYGFLQPCSRHYVVTLTNITFGYVVTIYNEISSISLVQTTSVKTVKLNFFKQIAIQ